MKMLLIVLAFAPSGAVDRHDFPTEGITACTAIVSAIKEQATSGSRAIAFCVPLARPASE